LLKIKKLIVAAFITISAIVGLNPSSTEAAIPTIWVENLIQRYVSSENPSMSFDEAGGIAKAILYYSYKYNVDPLIMSALIDTESKFNQNAVSSAGAIGMGQLLPSTASALGVNPHDTLQNIEGACSYMATQLNNFNGDTRLALAAYNAGSDAVKQYGGIPPFEETQNYVAQITQKYSQISGALSTILNGANYIPPEAPEPKYEVVYVEEEDKTNAFANGDYDDQVINVEAGY
jgi:lytic transglycosylase